MKILIDMNLSPEWVNTFRAAGIPAVHWSEVGKPNAPDVDIFGFAIQHDYIVFTHDLDFGAILSATNASGPSVIQVRTQDTMPAAIGEAVLRLIAQFETPLHQGALITLDVAHARVRMLLIRS